MNMDSAHKYFDRASLFFLCVLIFFIPISEAAIQISVSLAILSFIGATISKKFKNICSTNLDIPILVFFIFLCLTVVFATDPQKSLKTLLMKNSEWFLIFFIVVSTLNSKRRIGIFLRVLLFSAIVVCFDGIYQQIRGVDLFRGNVYNDPYAMSASFYHYNDFAGYLETLLPIVLSLYIFVKNKFSLFSSLFSILLGYCLIVTFSRGGYFASFVAFNFLTILSLLKLKIKNPQRTALTLVIFLNVLVLAFFLTLRLFPIGTIALRILDRSDSNRIALWSTAFSLFKTKPLFGYGPGSFMALFDKANDNFPAMYAHNCYLQQLVEIGIFGLFSFLSIIVAFLKTTLKSVIKNNDFLLLGIVCGLIAYLIHAGIDTHFYSMQLSDFFWIMLGLAIAIAKNGPIEI